VALVSIPVMGMGGTSDVGRRLGTVFTVVSIGALTGPPMCGAINMATGGFKATGYYAGTLFFYYLRIEFRLLRSRVYTGGSVMLSVIILLIARHKILGKLWGKI
jgi:MFS transporter, MCT family, solute carrier family 16 (monocarboxylic acid transporters), member 10